MDETRTCRACRWYEGWFGVCCNGYSLYCADCPPEPDATGCEHWEAVNN